MECPICGLPMEVIREWTRVKGHNDKLKLATIKCLRGGDDAHWIAGPALDLLGGE